MMRGAGLGLVGVAAVAAATFMIAQPADHPMTAAAHSIPSAPQTGDRISVPQGRQSQLALPGSERLAVKSVLNVPSRMKYGDFAWNEEGVPKGDLMVRVDLREQTIAVFRAGHEIGTAVILYGADEKPTPAGLYPIIEKRKQHRSNLYDAEMPYMLRLTNDGIAIHAADVRQGRATHGCIGVPDGFAEALFGVVAPGDKVAIVT